MNKLSKRVLSLLLALLMVLGTCDQALAAGLDNGRYENDNVIELPENPDPTEKPDEPEITPEPTPEVTPEPTPEVTPEPTPEVTPEPTPEITPEPTEKPVVEVKEAVDTAYSDKSEGEYTVAVAEGSYSSDEDVPVLKSVSVTPVEGRTVLEGWTISGKGKDLKLTVSVKTMPALEEGETLALVALNGSVQSSQLKVVTGEGDFASVTVSDSTTGIGLVKVAASAAEETPAEKTIETKEQTLPAGNVSINGFLPVGGSVTAVKQGAAKPQMVLKSVNRAASTQSTTSAPASNETVLASYDITILDENGESWQPEKAVTVTIKDDSFGDGKTLQIYHQGSNGREFVATVTSHNNTVSFPAEHFSVYVVVESVVPRLTVKFVNGTTEVATMYVKAEDTAAEVEKIINDPGAGTVPAGQVFKGWTTEQNYTKDTTMMTIADVRADAMAKAAALTADGSVTYYAAMFKQYKVTYEAPINLDDPTSQLVVVGTESVEIPSRETNAAYTVNQGFSTDDTHNFEGWKVVEGLSNIVTPSATADTLFENGTAMTIKGDVAFSTVAPKGHWLVFDENGKGATYNAPRFVEDGQMTSDAGLIEMVRNGYTFGGWYTDAACTDGKEFSFGGTIADTTTIYAKWTPAETANYTVLIWKQNLAGDGYDFVESVVVENARVGSTPTAVTTTGNNAGRVTGATYRGEAGFSFKETDQASKQVAPEGNTVVNVYWNRNQYTLTFQDHPYTETTSGSGMQYALIDGQYVQLTRYGNNNYWYNGQRYYGTRYTQGTGWTTVKEITALYQQNISDHFPIVGSNGATYNHGERWDPQSSTPFNEVLVYVDVMPSANVTFHLDVADRTTKTIYYYVEALPGEEADRTYNGMGFTRYKSVDAQYTFFTEAEDYVNLVGFTKGGSTYPPEAYSANGNKQNTVWNNDNARYVYCYYTRNVYSLNYMDGAYYDGNNNRITSEDSQGQLKVEENIPYNSDLTSYNKTNGSTAGANYYEPTAPEGYVFEGWYIDDACTQPYTFTTMPDGGLTVYAKWRQIQYRVFLHPNAGTDSTLDWGSDGQQMNFRVNFGGKISAPTGQRSGYEFYGWYTDAATTNVFTVNAQIRGGSPYDKTTHFTDPMDKWGNGATYNTDVDRFWITEEFNLYAKWSAKTIGADGIGIFYDANGGSNAPSDTALYKDNTSVSAGAAPTAPEDKVFDHWVLQTWNGTAYEDTTTELVPGALFTALKSDAKIEDETGTVVAPSAVDEGNHYTYTIQLMAVYKDKEEETPTHIDWYSNYGSENDGKGTLYHSNTGIKINEAVEILGAQTRKGYTFKGWTKTKGGTTADFLVWTGSGYTTSSGTAATHVAADEKQPYEDLFAVWEEADVTINYAVASDSSTYEGVSVAPTTETIKAASGTAAGSTASSTTAKYIIDYWTCDDGTEHVGDAAKFVPSKNAGGIYEAHTYYAHFKLNEATVTVHHYLKGTETKVADDVTSQETIGTEYTATPVTTYQEKNLTVDSYNPSQKVTVSAEGNVITIYYTLPLTITAETKSKTYDGNPLNGEYTISGELSSDTETIETALGTAPSITNVSESPKQYLTEADQAKITGIPSYYVVNYTPGTLTITKRSVTLTSESGEKPYDGTALTKPEVTVSGDGFVEGEATDIKATGSVTTVAEGEVTNTITYTEGANFKADNYTITKNEGKLKITQREVTVSVADKTVPYNGSEQQGNTETTFTNVVDGQTATIGYTASKGTLVNTYDNGAYADDFKVVDGDGKDVTGNYTLGTPTKGKLIITDEDIPDDKVVTKTDGEENDGKKYHIGDTVEWTVWVKNIYDEEKTLVVEEAEGMTITSEVPEKLAAGEEIEITVTHVVTAADVAAGSIKNEVKVKLGDLEKTGDDTVETEKIKITVTAASQTKQYDGTALTNGTFTVTPADPKVPVAEGDTVTATVTGSQTEVGSSANTLSNVKVSNTVIEKDAEGKEVEVVTDVTDAYDITLVNGTLTVTTVPYTINYVFTWPGGAAPAGAPNPPAAATVNRGANYTVSTATYADIPYGIAPNGNVITVLRFQGWDTTGTINNVRSNRTITGAWTIQMVWYTVTYTDGVPGEVVFPDQVTTTLRIGANTPAFAGTPTREGFNFTGWAPAVSPTVTGNNVYTAQWALIEEERIVEPTPEPTPVVEEEIIDEEVPQAAPGAAWALINLLAALGTVATAVGMIITFFKKKDDDDDGTKANPDEESDENKGKKSKFLGLIPAVASVIIFILTENMHNPMTLVDKWTIPMVLILAANGIVAYLTRNKKPEDEDTEKAAG